jgi:hypothetical protein
MAIDRHQWADWRGHPCTQEMIKILREIREEGYEEASYGTDDMLIQLGIKLGKINALTGVINLRFIPEEEENDGRNNR